MGEKVTLGGIPVPLSATVCMAGVALSAKLSVAFSAPPVDGLKVRITVQMPLLAATGVVTEQVPPTMGKSAAFGPVTFGALEKLSAAFPVLVSVTVMELLIVSCGTLPNGRFGGRLTTGISVAMAESTTPPPVIGLYVTFQLLPVGGEAPLIVPNGPVTEPGCTIWKLLPMAGTNPLTSVRFSVPARSAVPAHNELRETASRR